MTIIGTYTDHNAVYIASDTALSTDGMKLQQGIPKIFKKGVYVFGTCGDVWPRQALQTMMKIPKGKPPTNKDAAIAWIMEHFFFQIKKILASYKLGIKNPTLSDIADYSTHHVDNGSTMLIGWPAFAAEIDLDGTVYVLQSPWCFCGCGEEYAFGASHIIDEIQPNLPPAQKLKLCIQAACKYSPFCGGEIHQLESHN